MYRTKTESISSGSSNHSHEQHYLDYVHKLSNSIDRSPTTTATIKKSLIRAFMTTAKPAPLSNLPVIPRPSLTVPPEINDPTLFRPDSGRVRTNIVWEYYTIRGWLTKYMPPSYSFTKSQKARYVVLADRMLYTFKTDSPTPLYREFFELTRDTNVFVTDRLSGVMYCIEISKRDHREHKSWYLQCENIESLKVWLERLKKTVSWIRENHGLSPGIVAYHHHDQQQQYQEQQRLSGIHSSSSDSILSTPSSPTSFWRNTQLTDDTEILSSLDHRDLFYADEYVEWEPTSTVACQPPPMPHPMILPPQRPPPTSALPPLPTSQKFLV